MERRAFLSLMGAAGLSTVTLGPSLVWATARNPYQRLLILVELKGGNDGLNTLVPYADPSYVALRPRIALRRDEVLQLSEQAGFHPALQSLMPLWQQGELALIQGVGYPQPNLSHFRSIEIWDTASGSDEYLADGWLARSFSRQPTPADYVADGVVLGSQELGPLFGGDRAIVLGNPEQFLRQARLAVPGGATPRANPALAHVLKVEDDVSLAARQLAAGPGRVLATEFPRDGFGNTVRNACQVLALGKGVAVLRLTLGGFDTHQNQPGTQANLLRQLGDGLAALKTGLQELALWDKTLILTYAEFGRRPKENQSNGTDHGTANVHFALGGRVKGGFYGDAPRLDQLDGNGNLAAPVDFRSVYATALERWWGVDAQAVLGGRFAPLPLLRV
ncbi:MAG: DUF1501 domain-containing protein [Rhodocyclaceae bacterium]|nr:MAG: DUF1501 domain-containing protein [Rhodocyclaceae bacterium]